MVRDAEHRHARARAIGQEFHDSGFGGRIEAAGGLVHDQKPRL